MIAPNGRFPPDAARPMIVASKETSAMFAMRLAQAASPPGKARLAALPAAILRQAWSVLWRSAQDHVADLHGIPRPERRR